MAPLMAPYHPGVHCTHAADEFAAAALENVPAGHAVHDDAPGADHVPAPHVMLRALTLAGGHA